MLLASPQAGSSPALRVVIRFQSPIAPAQISGGVLNELRPTAATLPSHERITFVPHAPAVTRPASRHNLSLRPFPQSPTTLPPSPSLYPPNRIRFPSVTATP